LATNNSTNTPELTANGQLIIGNAGNNPSAATLTASTNMVITNAAGAITIATKNLAPQIWGYTWVWGR